MRNPYYDIALVDGGWHRRIGDVQLEIAQNAKTGLTLSNSDWTIKKSVER